MKTRKSGPGGDVVRPFSFGPMLLVGLASLVAAPQVAASISAPGSRSAGSAASSRATSVDASQQLQYKIVNFGLQRSGAPFRIVTALYSGRYDEQNATAHLVAHTAPYYLDLAGFNGSLDTPALDKDAATAVQRVADIDYRLASRGIAHCHPSPTSGLLFQILAQFAPGDRQSAIHAWQLDLGPRILAVASGSPAEVAGLRPDDVITAIDGQPPPALDLTKPAAQAAIVANLHELDERIARAGSGRATTLAILRGSRRLTVELRSAMACPSFIYLARSNQRNAFADGDAVLLPDGLVARIPDDNQLALLIAHEMAHNILGHAPLMRAARADGDRKLIHRLEDEADALGTELAIDAGYDVVAGSRVFFIGGGGIEFFPSHSSAKIRAERAIERARMRVNSTAAGKE